MSDDTLEPPGGPYTLINNPAVFPLSIHFGGSEEKITLHADGRYEGNVAELRKLMRGVTGFGDTSFAVLWLLLAEMERSPERRITP